MSGVAPPPTSPSGYPAPQVPGEYFTARTLLSQLKNGSILFLLANIILLISPGLLFMWALSESESTALLLAGMAVYMLSFILSVVSFVFYYAASRHISLINKELSYGAWGALFVLIGSILFVIGSILLLLFATDHGGVAVAGAGITLGILGPALYDSGLFLFSLMLRELPQKVRFQEVEAPGAFRLAGTMLLASAILGSLLGGTFQMLFGKTSITVSIMAFLIIGWLLAISSSIIIYTAATSTLARVEQAIYRRMQSMYQAGRGV